MPTIYRKYRPQTFSDITGQEHIIQTITNEIATNKVAHAYLFSGPRGVGKTTIARLLAKAINCQNRPNGKFEPCNECSSCQEISASRNIDVIEIDAASHTGVDNVRENIVENAQFKPTKSAFKVFIIDEVHMLSTSSFNALLKTLEEPPAHVIFIMATTELHKILPTIVSRCQRFAFQKIPFDQMMTRLEEICKQEEIQVDKIVLERIINKSDGCLRDAESLLGQILSLNLRSIGPADAELVLPVSNAGTVVDFVEKIISNEPAEAIKMIGGAVSDGVNLDQFAYDLLEILRVAMIAQSGQTNLNTDYTPETLAKIKKLSDQLTPGQLVNFIDQTMKRKQEIKTAPIPQLPLELLAIEMSTGNKSGSVSDSVKPNQPPNQTPNNTLNSPTPPAPPKEPNEKRTITSSIKSAISSIARPHHEITTPLEDIKTKWAEMIGILNGPNHSLTFVLKICELISTENCRLNITVPYSFHKEKVDDRKNKKIIEDCLSKLCNERITLECSVTENETAKAPIDTTDSQTIENVAVEFGGEVVAE